jgi:hypothetical protein
MSLTYPTVNNKAYSGVSLSLRISGDGLAGARLTKLIKAISHKTGVERGEVRGTDRQAYAHTAGKVTHEASITFVKEEFDALVTELGAGFMDKPLTLTVSTKEGSSVDTVTITASGMKEYGGDYSEGTDGLECVVPLDVLRILKNGVSPVTEPE